MAETVTTALLARRDPNLQERWPKSQSSWQEQIDVAVSDVRRDLRIRGFAWERFEGFVEGSGLAEDYDGSNAELNDLIETRALGIIYRACSRNEPGRWGTLAEHFENLYAALLDRYAGADAPGGFTTYDVDGSGLVEEDEQGVFGSNPPLKL